jgi:ActR/RegA family two-component response regulator
MGGVEQHVGDGEGITALRADGINRRQEQMYIIHVLTGHADIATNYNPINNYKIYHMTTKKWGIHCMHIRMPRSDAK